MHKFYTKKQSGVENVNKVLTRELLDLKFKVMIQKIDKLYFICNMLFGSLKAREIKALEKIKEQYFKKRKKLIELGKYEKYKEVEDMIIKEIAKVELNIDQYIYNTVQSYEEIIKNNMNIIYQSENYQSFSNLEQEIQHVETLKQLFKLYIPYISKNEIKRLYNDISILKFNVLWRRQVEDLIFNKSSDISYMINYSTLEEREQFKKYLQEKQDSLVILERESIENDEILSIPVEHIIKNPKLLERLIVIDISKNTSEYIGLLKAKIFNVHLCNIGNNPFPIKPYLREDTPGYGWYWNREFYRYYPDCEQKGRHSRYSSYGGLDVLGIRKRKEPEKMRTLNMNSANFSTLMAVLKNLAKDDNVNIVNCMQLYERFGFECNPITVNDGQYIVKLIYQICRDEENTKKIKEENRNENKQALDKYRTEVIECTAKQPTVAEQRNDYEKRIKTSYAIVRLDALNCTFDKVNRESEKYEFRYICNKRPIEKTKIVKRRFFEKPTVFRKKDIIQEIRDKAKQTGYLIKDFDILCTLYDDLINSSKDTIKQLGDCEFKIWQIKNKIEEYTNNKEELKKLFEKNGNYTLKEAQKFLHYLNNLYNALGFVHNLWQTVSLEQMSINCDEIYLVPFPNRTTREQVPTRHVFGKGWEYEDRDVYRSSIARIVEQYKKDWEQMKLDIKKYNQYVEGHHKPSFDICINLDNLSDLPIDYEKARLLSQRELDIILEREKKEREEGNEK